MSINCVCRYCGDGFTEWMCKTCDPNRIIRGACDLCHAEVIHDEVPKLTHSAPSVSDSVDGGGESPWEQNAVRHLEDVDDER